MSPSGTRSGVRPPPAAQQPCGNARVLSASTREIFRAPVSVDGAPAVARKLPSVDPPVARRRPPPAARREGHSLIVYVDPFYRYLLSSRSRPASPRKSPAAAARRRPPAGHQPASPPATAMETFQEPHSAGAERALARKRLSVTSAVVAVAAAQRIRHPLIVYVERVWGYLLSSHFRPAPKFARRPPPAAPSITRPPLIRSGRPS